MKRKQVWMALLIGGLSTGGALLGCNGGGNTHGGEEDFTGDTFVADGSTTGRIEIRLREDTVTVGGLAGFEAFAFDASGQPISNIRITCDSERELVIVEPTTGHEITSSYGAISGKLGCNAPGSFQFGCRLPAAGGIRELVDVKCTGDVPEGFAGYTGGAGGGLGGGVVTPDEGGPGAVEDQIRISDITPRRLGSSGESTVESLLIDTDVCTCDQGTVATDDDLTENFGDDFIQMKVKNNSSRSVQFTKYNYTVEAGRSSGGNVRSPDLNLVGEAAAAAPDSEVTLIGLFLKAASGGKTYGDGSTQVPDVGFRNVTFRLYGTTGDGEEIVITRKIAISFDSLNVCSDGGCLAGT